MNRLFILSVVLIFIVFIAIITTIFIFKGKRKKRFKDRVNELEYEKNSLISANILSELSKVRELVKTESLREKLNYWDSVITSIKEEKLDMITDMITEVDFLIERNNYYDALRKIAEIEMRLLLLRRKLDVLLDEIRVITNSEERNRSIITRLKAIYRECENKYERTKKEYGLLCGSIDNYFENIDKLFKDFEWCMDKNDYVLVETVVQELENYIDKLKDYLDKTPDLIVMASVMIPNKIAETKIAYSRMQRDGYPLDYLNMEYNLNEIQEKVDKVIINMIDFNLENADTTLKTILEYFNTVFNSFDKEKEAKDIFKENIKKLNKKLESVNKVVYDIYLQMDDIKSNYDLTDSDIGKFNIINRDLGKINEDYRNLYQQGKGKTFAYSKLIEELDGLDSRLVRLQDDLDYRLKSITSMRDDESRAREQLATIEGLLVNSKNKLKNYRIPVIPNSYFIELEEASEAIREIIKELNKKPIVIKVLNVRVDTARDLVFKIYNKTNDIVKSVIACENLIVYGNRYRTVYKDIDEALYTSEDLFRRGKYKQSIDVSIKAISVVDDSFMDKFDIEK